MTDVGNFHHFQVSYAPVLPDQKASHEETSVTEITEACFRTENQLVNCDAKSGNILSQDK